MKTKMLWAAFLACCVSGYSQLLLNPGDCWTYNFNTLPWTGTVPSFTTNPIGALQLTINGATFHSGDSLRFDIFENNTSESRISTGLLNSAPPFTASCFSDGAWQDRQGAIRLTMLSGSVTVDSITLQTIVVGPSMSQYDVYSSTFVPIPEPTTCSLVALSLALILVCRARRRA